MTACSPLRPEEDLRGKFGGTLRLLHVGSDPKTLNPWIASDQSSSLFGGILYEGLITTDPDTDEVKPHFAKEFKIEDGGRKITVILRDDIFWSDGKPITADDVLFTWNDLIRDGIAVSSLKDILLMDGQFPQVTAIDSKTIEFKTQKVFAPFLKYLGIEIAPKHAVGQYFNEVRAYSFEQKQAAFNNFLNLNSKPETIVSSGPFKLKRVESGQRIEFAKNQNYFIHNEQDQQLPYVDNLAFSYVKDSSTGVFKFLAGEAHIIDLAPQNVALLKSLESKYQYKVYDLGPSTGTSFLWFNLSTHVPEPQYSWFNNPAFRQAISLVINRDSVVNNVYQGLGAALFTAESLQSPFLNQEISQGFARDLVSAKELLLENGFKFLIRADNTELVVDAESDPDLQSQLYDADYDSIKLLDSNGIPIEFNLFTNSANPEREMIGVIVMNNLAELGVKINFKVLEFNNFVARVMQGKDYEAGIISLTGSNEPNGGANVWRSSGRLHMFDIKASQQEPITRDWELEIDKLFDLGVQSFDFEQRKKIYDRFQEIVFQQNPMIYIASAKNFSAVSDKIAGARPSKYKGVLPYLHEVYIKP